MSREYKEGYIARKAGLLFADNPYCIGLNARVEWDRGWLAASDEVRP